MADAQKPNYQEIYDKFAAMPAQELEIQISTLLVTLDLAMKAIRPVTNKSVPLGVPAVSIAYQKFTELQTWIGVSLSLHKKLVAKEAAEAQAKTAATAPVPAAPTTDAAPTVPAESTAPEVKIDVA